MGHKAKNIAVDKHVLYNYVHYAASQTNSNWTQAKARDLLDVNMRANAFLRSIGHPERCRRLPNLWIEALRQGGLRRFWQLTTAYVAILFSGAGTHTPSA